MIAAAPAHRPFRRPALVAATAAGLLAGGWWAAAQLAPGERGVPPIDSSSNLEVTGVHVDVAARSAEDARQTGWKLAQRKGWAILWARAHGLSPDAAPVLPDATLDGLISGIEIEGEQVGPHRYIADLGVLFDRGRTNPVLGGGGQAPRSQPMLVIPVQVEAGSEQSFEARTAWQKAWARFRAGASPVDYVRPVGTGPDPLLLQFGQTRRPGRLWWRRLLDQYGAADVVVPEVYLQRRFPGGPVAARFVALHGPDAAELGSFTLLAGDDAALPAMLDEGVRRIDAIYVAALGSGDLSPDPSLTNAPPEPPASEDLVPTGDDPLSTIIDQPTATPMTIQVDTPSAGALDAALATLRSVPGVSAPQVVSLALGGSSTVSLDFAGEPATLRSALAARGWRADEEGGGLRMRRAAAAPPGQPMPTEPLP